MIFIPTIFSLPSLSLCFDLWDFRVNENSLKDISVYLWYKYLVYEITKLYQKLKHQKFNRYYPRVIFILYTIENVSGKLK